MIRKKRRLWRFILLALLLLVLVVVVDFFAGYKVFRDVRYAEGEANVMDIYLPSEAYERESCGCVLFIHGGSWSGGDKREEEARCRLLASRGYIAATVNYTLWSEESAAEYTVFEVLDEIDMALARLKDFAAQRGIAIDRAALSGYSAGAHLALLYAYSRADVAPMEIAFVSSMAGPTEISPEIWGEDLTRIIGARLSGIAPDDAIWDSEACSAVLSEISPVSYVEEGTVPTILLQGLRDTTVSPANATALCERLLAASVKHEAVYLKNSDHSLLQNPIRHLGYYGLLLEYCKLYFD